MSDLSNTPAFGLSDTELMPEQGDFPGNGRLAVRDPSTGALVAQVAMSDATGARAAVDAAQAAFPDWSTTLPQVRAEILHRWHALIMEAKEDLSRIMVAEQGKPISEARGEIDYAASFVQFYAEEALRPNIEGVTSHLHDAEMELWREPVGVAALITPWNFPCAMITRKAAAALAAGCTVVIHPSAETPLSALALAELARRAGFPEGVVNTVIGDAATIVGEWTADTRVRALSFTGSTEVGRLLYRQSADTVKRLVLELGGHAPFIVFKDADLDRAVAEAIKAKFATSGQDCLGANRFYIERPVYQEFCERFTRAVEALTMGRGMDDPDIGPLIHERAVEKQVLQVNDALKNGAKLLTGGAIDHDRGPLFFQPTVLADVPDAAAIMSEENFGPVAPLTPFDDEGEVIGRANATEYGLVAYVHSLDPRRIYRLTRALQFGMVAVNRTKVTGAPIPFGGTKQSGIGREGARQGLEAFTDIKYVCRDWG
ncbi:NAD-dependent succinate-semialdehyde dehydrogenase [Salipiger profundus]|jgi:aspartate-semialdehyde dehydrogenase|uniref:Succinate semialdehyde dehydrogenase n=2 Tax=Roseobacteraceae TaxID=2854170 RepID=A0A1U7DBA7_9RHOB|nr:MULTISPECIES: NAD-dependent succinate-semialdehyde dehydrogenase [Salipiger]APX25392.1 succinate semialdehyde dehydrogenase [Salipiger profundus]GGA27957.1 NAD-dependent succinate-semialdehyde dehydrogenase [Salipiger profundus]SFD81342.1 succinate semialdehyde dehydrogenase [Salipiger profundus]